MIKGKTLLLICTAILAGFLVLCSDPSIRRVLNKARTYVYARYIMPVPSLPKSARLFVRPPFKGEQILISHAATSGMQAPPNSEEGFRKSVECGFRYIELDLLETTDGNIISAHDWASLRKQAGMEVNDKPLSTQDIISIRKEGRSKPLFASEICQLLTQYPDVVLVTDKIRNYELLLKEIPFPERMIVEVYGGVEHYAAAVRAGVKYPALNLPGDRITYDVAMARKVPIVTVGNMAQFGQSELEQLRNLHEAGIVVMLYCYQIKDWDNEQFVAGHAGRVFSMIYTDSWSPQSWDSRSVSRTEER